MTTNSLAGYIVAVIAIGTAHTAGAGYVLARNSGVSQKWPIVRTLISLALVALAIRLVR